MPNYLVLSFAAAGLILSQSALEAKKATAPETATAITTTETTPVTTAKPDSVVKVETTAAVPKAKRTRSAKQLANDQIMRDCGAEWRSEKAAGKTKGTTWRKYLKECRAKKKSA